MTVAVAITTYRRPRLLTELLAWLLGRTITAGEVSERLYRGNIEVNGMVLEIADAFFPTLPLSPVSSAPRARTFAGELGKLTGVRAGSYMVKRNLSDWRHRRAEAGGGHTGIPRDDVTRPGAL